MKANTNQITLILLLGILISFGKVRAQEVSSNYSNPVPPAPNVAVLGKFGEIPVSKYTGIPGISIPLYTINLKNFELPISVDYHPGGIKVSDEASFVGLGWALRAGGAITQAVNDWDDLDPQFGIIVRGQLDPIPYYNMDQNTVLMYNQADVANCNDRMTHSSIFFQATSITGANTSFEPEISKNCIKSIVSNEFFYDVNKDNQPDIFHFSFGAYSGKFVYDKYSGSFQTIKRQNIDIKYLGRDIGWKLTDPYGVQYWFNEVELMNTVSTTFMPPARTFYITKIKLITGEEINFSYLTGANKIGNLLQMSETQRNCISTYCYDYDIKNNTDNSRSYYQTCYTPKYLESIDFGNGTIEFSYDSSRLDLPNAKRLTGVKVYNNISDTPVKSIDFDNDQYFQGHNSTGYTSKGMGGDGLSCDFREDYSDNRLYKRLKLDAIKVSDMGNDYQFYYNEEISLPSKLSYACDYWGYYNGNDNENSFIPDPATHYEEIAFTPDFYQDRRPNSNMSAWVINKIIYPTGGWSEFVFEPNTFSNASLPSPISGTDEEVLVSAFYSDFYNDLTNSISPPFILNHGTNVNISIKFEADIEDNYTIDHNITFQIKDINNNVVFEKQFRDYTESEFSCQDPYENYSIYLNAGTYTTNISKNDQTVLCSPENGNWISGKISYNNSENEYSGGAGLRVAEIKNFDGNNYITKKYRYENIDKTISYGAIQNVPSFSRNIIQLGKYYNNNFLHINVVTSHAFNGLSTSASGSFVGYSKVIETIQNENEYGTIEYTFLNQTDFCQQPNNLGSCLSYACFNGREDKIRVIDNSGKVLKEQIFDYYQEQRNKLDLYGIKIEDAIFNDVPDYCGNPYNCAYIHGVYLHYYPISGFRYDLKSKTTKTLDKANDLWITEKEEYTYTFNGQIKSKLSTNSDGIQKKLIFTYPQDYAYSWGYNENDDVEAIGIKAMYDNKIVAVPIEVVKLSDEKVVGGNINTFKVDDSGRIVPNTSMKLEIDVPLDIDSTEQNDLTKFNSSYVTYDPNNSKWVFKKDNFYPENPNNTFHFSGANLVQVDKKDDLSKSYVWDYNGQYPIAQVTNARYNEIAYTSFEEGFLLPGWGTPFGTFYVENYQGTNTGNKVYKGISLLTPTLPTGKYVVSFWALGSSSSPSGTITVNGNNIVNPEDVSGGYYQAELTLNASSTVLIEISSGIALDELRFYPLDAQMTTYTYEPLVGITSVTSPDNRTTTYKYDDFGRLEFVKDHNGDIVNKYKYYYKEEPFNEILP